MQWKHTFECHWFTLLHEFIHILVSLLHQTLLLLKWTTFNKFHILYTIKQLGPSRTIAYQKNVLSSLLISQTFIQNVCILAGSLVLFCWAKIFAQHNLLLSSSMKLSPDWSILLYIHTLGYRPVWSGDVGLIILVFQTVCKITRWNKWVLFAQFQGSYNVGYWLTMLYPCLICTNSIETINAVYSWNQMLFGVISSGEVEEQTALIDRLFKDEWP